MLHVFTVHQNGEEVGVVTAHGADRAKALHQVEGLYGAGVYVRYSHSIAPTARTGPLARLETALRFADRLGSQPQQTGAANG